MQKGNFLLAGAVCMLGYFAERYKAQTNVYDTIIHGSLKRTYLLHIPPSYHSSQSTPLVIGLHGGGSLSWLNFEQVSKLISQSDAAGFLLVYPEGVKFLGTRTWNGGGCCGYAASSNINDVGFISALIDSLRLQYNIDTNRIYATGFSNGAIMAYRLACQLSNRIAAIAPVAGTLEDHGGLPATTYYTCNPVRRVPVMLIHSVADSNIYLQGGYGVGPSGYYFNPVKYGLQKFASLNHCIQGPDSAYYISGSSYYYKKRWHSCSCHADVTMYVTGDGGHSWPGGQKGSYAGADPPSAIFKANDSIWKFFQKHSLGCNPAKKTEITSPSSSLNLYPNPASRIVFVEFDVPFSTNFTLVLCNAYGRIVRQLKGHSHNNNKTIPLSVENLPAGVYFVQLHQEGNILAVRKLVLTE